MDEAKKRNTERDIVRSVVKAFRVLESFSDVRDERTVAEISRASGLDRAVSYRMALTLEHLGYLERGRDGKSYRLALKCLELGMNALAGLDVRAIAAPKLRGLVPAYGDAASLGVLEGADVVYIDRVEHGLNRSGLMRRIGSRIPVYGAAIGFALLAFLPRDRQVAALNARERVRLSERTITNLDELLQVLNETAERGFAISDQQNAFGLRTIAAPILGRDGRALAAVSLTIAVERMDMEAFIALSRDRLVSTAREISKAVCALSEINEPR